MVPLETSKLFHTLSEPELCSVRQVARELRFATGEIIFKEGDPGDGIYLVKSGVVQIIAFVNEERRVLSRISPGDLFGEMAVLDNDPRSATASAETDVVLDYISRTDLLNLLERIPRLSACLVREISRRLRDFNRHYIQETLQAERLSLVGRFARSIVHDLKNPLNIIGIAAELIGMDGSTPESRELSRVRIRKQVDRITNMINELLEFTRGSQSPVAMNRFNYADFVQQVVEDLRQEANMRLTSVEIENPPPVILLQIDPPRLARVFQNLIHNATEAMPDGGKIILRFQTGENEIATVIEDTGPGIPPEMSDKLFQAFATHGKMHGTGLGLSICKRIIEDHRGQIFTKNEPGRGAIFVFTLPIPKEN